MILAVLIQAATASPPPPPPPAPPWTVIRTTARGAPATTASAWSQDGKARLVVRCDTASAPIVSLQFIPRTSFTAASPRPVSLNADDGGWFGTNWQFPGNGAFVSDDVVVTNLAVIVAHAHAIRVRVVDPAEGVVEANFAGPPGDAPIRAVLAACGYELGKVPPRSMPKAAPAAAAEPADPAEDK